MFTLHAVQARFGDSVVLSFGTARRPRHVLIDGGPSGNYAANLAPALDTILNGRKLDLVILSHVDNDHIIGVLDLLAAVEEDEVSARDRRVEIGGLWHNSFDRTIDASGVLSQDLQSLMLMAGATSAAMPFTADALFGIKEGSRVRLMAKKLRIPVNKGFDDLISVEAANKPIKLGPLELRIAGPSRASLQALRKEWQVWLEKATEAASSDPAETAMVDKSIPNLSSIVILAKCDDKTLLLTGDARGDHIIDGLKAAGIAKKGKLHVDVLKVQHHGSSRNTTRAFFDAISADTYVISADGRYGNPDFETLKWIVESAADGGRRINLVMTNETEAVKQLQRKLKPTIYGYTLAVLPNGDHSISVPLSD
jgi:hypothetical protein